MERLRKIYAAQGMEVPDRVIDQAVAALKEERFAYKAPPHSMAIRLARLYVRRGIWGKRLGGLAVAGVLGLALYYFAVAAPAAALPRELDALHREVAALAATAEVRATVDSVYGTGQAALRARDRSGAREALAKLRDLGAILDQEYEIRIVNRPGEYTGLWRIPDANTGARNYYLVVEALDPSGRAIKVPVQSEETKATDRVERWGLRVDQRTFRSVSEDKQDDGIVQRDRVGHKARGRLEPDYSLATSGGAITRW